VAAVRCDAERSGRDETDEGAFYASEGSAGSDSDGEGHGDDSFSGPKTPLMFVREV
jgi:hypothetical protein